MRKFRLYLYDIFFVILHDCSELLYTSVVVRRRNSGDHEKTYVTRKCLLRIINLQLAVASIRKIFGPQRS